MARRAVDSVPRNTGQLSSFKFPLAVPKKGFFEIALRRYIQASWNADELPKGVFYDQIASLGITHLCIPRVLRQQRALMYRKILDKSVFFSKRHPFTEMRSNMRSATHTGVT